MHPVKDWRNFRQRYRLIGSYCSSCGAKFISPDQRCANCSSAISPAPSLPAALPVEVEAPAWRLQLSDAQHFFRWQDWGFSKIPLICTVCFYIALTYNHHSLLFVFSCLAFLLFAVSHSALAYVMNDWGDRFADRRHGKWNAFLGLSQQKSLIILVLLILTAVLSIVPFVQKTWFLWLWLLWTVVVSGYLLPPLHLKERGRGWRILEIIAQWVLPVCLAFAAFGHFGGWDMFLYALVLAIAGTSLDRGYVRQLSTSSPLSVGK